MVPHRAGVGAPRGRISDALPEARCAEHPQHRNGQPPEGLAAAAAARAAAEQPRRSALQRHGPLDDARVGALASANIPMFDPLLLRGIILPRILRETILALSRFLAKFPN